MKYMYKYQVEAVYSNLQRTLASRLLNSLMTFSMDHSREKNNKKTTTFIIKVTCAAFSHQTFTITIGNLLSFIRWAVLVSLWSLHTDGKVTQLWVSQPAPDSSNSRFFFFYNMLLNITLSEVSQSHIELRHKGNRNNVHPSSLDTWLGLNYIHPSMKSV